MVTFNTAFNHLDTFIYWSFSVPVWGVWPLVGPSIQQFTTKWSKITFYMCQTINHHPWTPYSTITTLQAIIKVLTHLSFIFTKQPAAHILDTMSTYCLKFFLPLLLTLPKYFLVNSPSTLNFFLHSRTMLALLKIGLSHLDDWNLIFYYPKSLRIRVEKSILLFLWKLALLPIYWCYILKISLILLWSISLHLCWRWIQNHTQRIDLVSSNSKNHPTMSEISGEKCKLFLQRNNPYQLMFISYGWQLEVMHLGDQILLVRFRRAASYAALITGNAFTTIILS